MTLYDDKWVSLGNYIYYQIIGHSLSGNYTINISADYDVLIRLMIDKVKDLYVESNADYDWAYDEEYGYGDVVFAIGNKPSRDITIQYVKQEVQR